MNYKTNQFESFGKPLEENQDIGLTIACLECGTLRTFKIDQNLTLLNSKLTDSCGIKTECEKCGHKIAVIFSWINASKVGYSYRVLDIDINAPTNEVRDENGLTNPHN